MRMHGRLGMGVLAAVLAGSASADLVSWDGGAGTGTNQIWANIANWNPDGAPVATNDYLVQGSFTIRCPDLDGNLGLNGASLTVTNGATLLMYVTYNGGGATRSRAITNLTIAGSTLNSQTSNGTFTHALTQRARFLGTSSIGLLNAGYGVGLNLNAGIEGSGTINVTRNNSGSTSVLLLGGYAGDYAGSWMLTGQSSARLLNFNVATTNNSGWGTGNLSLGNFALVTVQSNVASTGSTVIFSNATAQLTLNANRLLTIGGLSSTVGGTNLLNSGSTVTVGNATTDRSFNGVILGSGALVKQQANVQTLSGANTFTGGTTINGGTLRLAGGANRLATGGNVTVADAAGATLDLNGQSQQVAALNAGGASGGQVTLGGGTLTLGGGTLGGTIAGAGTVALASGSFTVGPTALFNGPQTIAIAAVATVDVQTASFALTNGQVLTGSGLVLGNATAGDGATIRPGTGAGTLTVAGDLLFGTGATNVFELTADTSVGGSNDLLIVAGTLMPNGATIYVKPSPALTNGTYTLFTYGTKTGSFAPDVVVPAATRSTLTLDESTPNLVQLIVAGLPAAIRWTGGFDANWDTGATNWQLVAGGTDTRFFDVDSVLFDDQGATQNVVTLNGTVRPGAIGVDSSSNYQFTGAGSLADAPSVSVQLTKAGTGELRIDTANAFSGGTLVSNGTIVAGNNNALGGGPVALVGGVLAADGGSWTLTNAFALSMPANLVETRTGDLLLSGVVSGLALRKSGTGNLVLGGANTFTGGLTVSKGGAYLRTTSGAGTAVVVLGDEATGAGAVALYLDANRQQFTRGVVVSSNAAGTVTIGSRATITGTGDNNNFQGIVLQRDVVFDSNAADRTDYRGVTGTGNIRITGSGRTVLAAGNNFTGNVTVATTGAGHLQTGVATAGNQNYLPDTSTLTVEGGALYRLSSGGENIDGLSGAGAIDVNAINGTLRTGSAGGGGTFSGVLADAGANKLSLVKLGAGTQVLSGINTLSGTVAIEGGTLSLGGTGSLTGVTAIAIGTGAVFDVTGAGFTIGSVQTLQGNGIVTGTVAAAAGAQLAAGSPGLFGSRETLTINGDVYLNAGVTNRFNLGAVTNAGGPDNDLIAVLGVLEPLGATIAVDAAGPLANGAYRLFTYGGSKTTTFDPTVRGNATRKIWTLDESIAGEINLNVSGSFADLVWRPVTVADWSLALDRTNWFETAGSTTTYFANADTVLFDESGAYSNVVNLTAPLMPASIAVIGASNYTISGTGRVSGVASLGKDGAGILTLGGTSNDFLGAVVVSGGVLRAGAANVLGAAAGTTTVRPGGTLDVNGFNLGPEPVVLAGGTLVNHGAAQQQALTSLTVTANSIVGGTNRWDVRGVGAASTVSGGATLTKALGTEIVYLGVDGTLTNDGVIAVNQGRVAVWNTAIRGTGSFAVAAGALLGIESFSSNPLPVTLNGGALGAPTGANTAQQGGDVLLTASSLLVATSGTFNVNGVISDGGAGYSITKNGGATVNILGECTYGGGTFVQSGSFQIGTGGTNGSVRGAITNNAGLYFNRSDAIVLSNNVTGTGSVFLRTPAGLTVNGSAAVNAGGNLSVGQDVHGRLDLTTGGVIAVVGEFQVGNPNAAAGAGTVYINGGTMTVGFRTRLGHWGSEVSTFAMDAGSFTQQSNAFNVGWDGIGQFHLRGGTLTALGLQLDGNGNSPGVNGTNNLIVATGGSLVLGASGLNPGGTNGATYLGGVTIGAYSSWTGTLPAQLTGTNGSTVVNPGLNTIVYNGALGGAGGLIKTGNGLLVLGVSNAFSGDIAINGGTLSANAGGSLGAYANTSPARTITLGNSGSTLNLALNDLFGTGVGQTNLPTIVVNAGGVLAASRYNAIGRLTLNGGTVAGTHHVDSATFQALQLLGDVTVGGTNASAIAVLGTNNAIHLGAPTVFAVADATGDTNADLVVSSPLINQSGNFGSAAGSLVKTGVGTLELAGTNTYAGATAVSGGTLRVTGVSRGGPVSVAAGAKLEGNGVIAADVTSDGTVAPGTSPGLLTLASNYTQNAGGTLAIELGGNVAGVSHDELIVSNTASLAGALSVTLVDGFIPATNDVFIVLDAATVGGTFGSASLPGLPPGQGWEIQYLPGEVALTITSGSVSASGYDLAATVITNGLSGYNDDADGDGYANLLEYVTGGSLTNADTNARMSGGRTNNVLALKFLRDTAATDATLYVEGSYTATNNADWVGIATNTGGSWGAATNVSETGPGPVSVTVQDTISSATNRFLRLRVTRP